MEAGNTTELPSMLEERNGCAAVITGNTIVVMGGRGQSGRVKSVEAFTLGGYSWRYLPAMKSPLRLFYQQKTFIDLCWW